MRALTQIGVAALALLAGAAGAAELELSSERAPQAAAAANCAARLTSARPIELDALRALLLAPAPPLPPQPPLEPFTDAQVGRVDCSGTPEPERPLAAHAPADGRLALDVPEALDAGCWEIAIARGCARERIPLHVLRPEHEPGRFAVWLETGPQRARAAVRREADANGLRVLDATPLGALGGTLLRLAFEEGADPALAAEALARLGAQPELRQRALVFRGSPDAEASWGARRIGAEFLHASAHGDGIAVALIGSAPASGHPDLPAPAKGSRDFTGYAPAAALHGTALAGVLAASQTNEIGAFGVAPRARLLALTACHDEPAGTAARCWSSALVRALDAALAAKARIALLGFSGPQDALVARALERAAERGLVLIAPAGDAGAERSVAFPASHAAVLGVTAVDREGAVFAPAARGEDVELAAPGVDIQSAVPESADLRPLSGTALAAAHVAGAAALLLQLAPRTSADALRATLSATAVDLGEPARDPVFGAGLVDVCGAARALLAERGVQEDPCPGKP